MQIKHITFETPDIISLEPFYRDTLGLPIVSKTDDELIVKIGATNLKFQLAPGFDGAYHIAINIPENQFEQGVAWLTARVKPIADSAGNTIFTFPEWNAHSIYFYDPVGNVLELISRHDLPTASDKPFTSASMLSVSEVGLGTEDAPTAASHLRAEIVGLGVFHNSENELFSALGTDEGLFIVVNSGREWYPETGKFSGLNPITVLLEESGRQFQLSAHPLEVKHMA